MRGTIPAASYKSWSVLSGLPEPQVPGGVCKGPQQVSAPCHPSWSWCSVYHMAQKASRKLCYMLLMRRLHITGPAMDVNPVGLWEIRANEHYQIMKSLYWSLLRVCGWIYSLSLPATSWCQETAKNLHVALVTLPRACRLSRVLGCYHHQYLLIWDCFPEAKPEMCFPVMNTQSAHACGAPARSRAQEARVLFSFLHLRARESWTHRVVCVGRDLQR